MHADAVLFDLFDTLVIVEGSGAYYEKGLHRIHEQLTRNGINVSYEEFLQAYMDVRDQTHEQTDRNLEEPHFNVRISKTLLQLGYGYSQDNTIVFGASMAFAGEFMRYVHMDEETPELLRQLHGKYRLGIVSNFAVPEAVHEMLEKLELRRFFDAIVISGEVNRRKPSSEIFNKALNSLGMEASRTVFVGDTPVADIVGAKNVGMRAILVERKPLGTLPDPKPDSVVRRLSELPDILDDC